MSWESDRPDGQPPVSSCLVAVDDPRHPGRFVKIPRLDPRAEQPFRLIVEVNVRGQVRRVQDCVSVRHEHVRDLPSDWRREETAYSLCRGTVPSMVEAELDEYCQRRPDLVPGERWIYQYGPEEQRRKNLEHVMLWTESVLEPSSVVVVHRHGERSAHYHSQKCVQEALQDVPALSQGDEFLCFRRHTDGWQLHSFQEVGRNIWRGEDPPGIWLVLVLGYRAFEPFQGLRYVVVASDRWLYRNEILWKGLKEAARKERELRAPAEGRDQLVWESRVHSSFNFGKPYDELAGVRPPEQSEGEEPGWDHCAAGSGDFLGVELRGEDAREASEQTDLVAASASSDWLRDADQNRERLQEEARAAAGEGNLRVERTLRQTWQAAQCADPALLPWMKSTASRPESLRLAEDGLLERSVRSEEPTLRSGSRLFPRAERRST